eukprot:SAG11_NODE_3448_length_2441_cov_3.742101_5_plen_45_part_00
MQYILQYFQYLVLLVLVPRASSIWFGIRIKRITSSVSNLVSASP